MASQNAKSIGEALAFLGVCAGLYWLIFGQFALDAALTIVGGAAGLLLTFGTIFALAEGRQSGKQIAAWWVGAFVVWCAVRWLADLHPWRQ